MTGDGTASRIGVARAPARLAVPYLRLFYDALRVDSDPRYPLRPDLAGCLWYPCTLDGAPVGGFLLLPKAEYMEVHTLLVPPARGAAAVAVARAALQCYRAEGGGPLLACAYDDNRAAQTFIAAVGFHRIDTVDEGATRFGHPVRAIYYTDNREFHHG